MTIWKRLGADDEPKAFQLFCVFIDGERQRYLDAVRFAKKEYDQTSSRDSWAWPAVCAALKSAQDELDDFDERVDTLCRGFDL